MITQHAQVRASPQPSEPTQTAAGFGRGAAKLVLELGGHNRGARTADQRVDRVLGQGGGQVQPGQGEAQEEPRARRGDSAQKAEEDQLRQADARVPALSACRAEEAPRAVSSTHAQQVPQVQSTHVRRLGQDVAQAAARVGRESRQAQRFQV